ncbi:aromatic ring-hydroxylating dioxygenase subunit alpha [bacterium]|nr:aromatic ring-hydroxylating dioxygenase subunit alpha [bacterium]
MTRPIIVDGGLQARLGSGNLSTERYVSPAYHRLELERLWPRVWHVAGRATDLQNPGDYFTYEFGPESVLCVRQDDGSVRAFHNICVHRGRRLRDPGSGTVQRFRCAYHHWEYGRDGRLERLPEPDLFPQLAGRFEQCHLVPVACEELATYVWVHFGGGRPSLREFLGPMAERLLAYDLDACRLISDQSAEVACNWKVAVDNANEGYHVSHLHEQLRPIYDESQIQLEILGDHNIGSAPFGIPSPLLEDREAISDMLRGLMQEAGLDPAAYQGSAVGVRAAIAQHLRGRAPAEFDFSRLADPQLTDFFALFVFPNLSFAFTGLSHVFWRMRPHPTDPGRSYFDQQMSIRVPKGQPAPPRPPLRQFKAGEESLGAVPDQDVHNFARVQQGLQSRALSEVILGEKEFLVRHFHAVLDRYLSEPPPR